jgi:hypothetical protein
VTLDPIGGNVSGVMYQVSGGIVLSSPAILTGLDEKKTGPSRFIEDFFQ